MGSIVVAGCVDAAAAGRAERMGRARALTSGGLILVVATAIVGVCLGVVVYKSYGFECVPSREQ